MLQHFRLLCSALSHITSALTDTMVSFVCESEPAILDNVGIRTDAQADPFQAATTSSRNRNPSSITSDAALH